MTPPARLIVITGSSGVGKSTLARALQEHLLPEQWLHFSVDTLFYCLPHSVVARVDQYNDRSQLDSKAIIAGAQACVRTLLDRGLPVIFDAVILSDKGAQGLLAAFEGYEPLIVELTCAWDVIEQRTLARGDRTLAEAEHGFKLAGGHLRAHHAFDSSATPAAHIARELVARMRGPAPDSSAHLSPPSTGPTRMGPKEV